MHYWPTGLPGLEVLPSPEFGAGRCALSARCFSVFLLSWRGWWVLASSWAFVPLFAGGSIPYLGCCWFLGLLQGYTMLLLYWLPLFGACSRRCSSCWPPELRFGLRSPWCVCFFLDLGCLPHFWPGCLPGSCWFSRRGLVVLTLCWVWCAIGHGVPFPTCWVSGCVSFILDFGRAFVRWWLCPVWVPVGFYGLLRDIPCCSFTGCRCLAPAPSSWPAKFRFGLRSRWCVCFFLPCALLAPSVCLVLAGVLPLAAAVPYVLGSYCRVFSSSCVLGVPSLVGGPVRDLGSCWFLGR